jgi:hypothetical protein
VGHVACINEMMKRQSKLQYGNPNRKDHLEDVSLDGKVKVMLKSSIFKDITPCSSSRVSRRFGGTCRLYLQCRRISQARNQHEADSKLGSCLAYSSTLKM